VVVERALEARDVLRLDAIVSWNRQLAAELEQDVLDAGEQIALHRRRSARIAARRGNC
jgi:hypothetical protein